MMDSRTVGAIVSTIAGGVAFVSGSPAATDTHPGAGASASASMHATPLAGLSDASVPVGVREDRNVEEWDLPRSDLAIKGYDPVAYFPEGGGKAIKGKQSVTVTHEGVTYRFATTANRDRFVANPDRYEPAHGLWCSWAMSSGEKTAPNPKSFIVKDNRLFLFYDGFWGSTRDDWLKGDHDELAKKADAEWKDISGEDKRAEPEVEVE